MQISLMQNATSTAVNSDEAEQKKAVDKPAKNQQRGHQKTQRLLQQIRRINNTSQEKGKKILFISLLHPVHHPTSLLNYKSPTEHENITKTFILKMIFLIKILTKRY